MTRYYLKVAVEGDMGDGAVSETAWFETAKEELPWSADFIETEEGDAFHPVFFRDFSLKKGIKRAVLYVTGLGLYEAYLNGEKAGDDYLAPFCNDYREHIQYQTYDVTELCKDREENRLEIFLGNGWYKGRLGYEGGREFYGSRFCAIAELHIWYENGETERIVTDDTWKYRPSDIIESDIYDGEIYDHQYWKEKGTVGKAAKPVVDSEEKKKLLTARYSLPVHVKEELSVKEVLRTPAGETVLDFGQNFAGYVTFFSRFPAGTKVSIDYGEILQNGNFYRDNYRTAKANFTYVSDGREEWARPHFTYYGFRYVRVEGVPGALDPDDFKGAVVYSDLDTVTKIHTSDEHLNRLAKNSLWGQKSNFIDMPTDCPQRDERLGWTGDAQVYSPTACYHMDTRAFYQKFLYDLHLEQRKQHGAVPNFLPNLGNLPGGSSVWGDVATFLPMTLYRHYGDKDILAENYEMMREWVDYIISQDVEHGENHLWNFGFHFGDWLAQDGVTPQSMKGGTDDYYVASIYYYASVRKVARAAEILGKSEDCKFYAEKAEKIYQAILDEYFSKNGRLCIDTQTAYLLALKFNVYTDKERIREGLKNRLKKDCYKIKGGFVGATMMCQVLAENGFEDMAYYLLFQRGFPGWMHCIDLGATTIWERWNSVLDDGSISGTGMNSLNHYSFGSVMEYVYRYIAGIRELEPGFRRVLFQPQLSTRLRQMEYTYDSVSGAYVSNWKIYEDGTVSVHFEVPFGCSAVAVLPGTGGEEVNLSAGVFEKTYQPDRDYRLLYTMDTRLEELMEDENAREILEKELPVAFGIGMSGDEEQKSLSLEEMKYMSFLGFKEEEVLRAAEQILKLKR
ncbi:MAG: family 78 glycoside hydrolase catalytic domain [Lachnospiraceae bacterium]|nr:family 78 glycoside hydrolase catalytic domain [Lachnospiraceae bacterium]